MRRSLWILLMALAAPLHAQFPAEVRGRVTDRETGAGVPGASVEVVGRGAEVRTASDGSFLLRGLLPGARELRVSAFGFRSRRVTVEAENGRTVTLAVALDPEPLALPALRVEARREGAGGATVVEREEIASSGARDLGELLRGRAGMAVVRRGGPGAPAHLSIRGGSADQVLVLVDGVPLNSPLTGEADLSTLPLETVERVTVLRGARSARYGGRALSGVVLVETRRPAGGEVGGRVGAGAWGERAAAASAGVRFPGGGAAPGALLSGEWRSVRGDFPVTLPAVRGGGRAIRHNGDASSGSLLATASLERGGTEVRGRAEAFGVERGMPGSIVQPSLHARQRQHRLSGGLTAQGEAGGVGWRGVLDGLLQRAAYADPDPPLGPAYDERVEAGSVGASLSAGGRLGRVEVTGGVEGRRTGFSSTMLEAAPGAQTLGAAWVQGRWTGDVGGWAVELHPGLRADRVSLLEGTAFSPRLAASLGRGRVRARISAGGAFSPPSLADQFFQEGVFARPNPDLRPERVRNEVEGGVEVRDVRLGALRVEGEASAYRADVEGMILWFPDHRFVWRPENFDVRRAGWEASGRASLPRAGAELGGSVSYVSVEYDTPALDGQVVYRPRVTASLSAAAEAAGVRGEVQVRHAGARRVSPGSALNVLPPYWMADARLRRPFALRGWEGEATLGVENLLDRDAAMLVDHPYPGRAWSVGLRVRHPSRREEPGASDPSHPIGEIP